MFLRNSAHLRTFTRGVEGRIPTRKNSKKKRSRGNEVAETAKIQNLREKNWRSGARARARARLFSRLRNFAGGSGKARSSEAARFR